MKPLQINRKGIILIGVYQGYTCLVIALDNEEGMATVTLHKTITLSIPSRYIDQSKFSY